MTRHMLLKPALYLQNTSALLDTLQRNMLLLEKLNSSLQSHIIISAPITTDCVTLLRLPSLKKNLELEAQEAPPCFCRLWLLWASSTTGIPKLSTGHRATTLGCGSCSCLTLQRALEPSLTGEPSLALSNCQASANR